MKKEFKINEWLKVSYKILKVNWTSWVSILLITTGVLTGILYFSFQLILPSVLDLFQSPENPKDIIFKIISTLGFSIFALLFLFSMVDLFLISTASQWYSGKTLAVEETFVKSIGYLPLSIILNLGYLIMAMIAASFFFFPVIFVIVFFLFITQAMIIENKGLGSFARSIEIIKQSFGNFMVLPFLISFVFQFINSIPFLFLQVQFQELVALETLNNMTPIEIFQFFSDSPQAFVFIAIIIFNISLQSNLKSILYTIAFEMARENKPENQAQIVPEDRFS